MSNPSLWKPIRDAIVTALNNNKEALGIKTVTHHFPTEQGDPVEIVKKFISSFPAAIVQYRGRIGRNEGKDKIFSQTYAVLVITENVSGPFAAIDPAFDLVESVGLLIDGAYLDPTQSSNLDLKEETTVVQIQKLAIHHLLFDVETIRRRLK